MVTNREPELGGGLQHGSEQGLMGTWALAKTFQRISMDT